MWFFAGENVTLNFDFKVDGEFVVPTSASYLLRNHAGLAVGSAVTLTGLTTSASITIPAISNELTVGSLYENRFVLVSFIHNGRNHTLVQPYKIAPFMPITAVPDDVRRLVGLSEAELPDRDIDIMSAYFQLYDAYATDFSNQLVATNYKNRLANESIALQAAIDVAISFPLRVPVSVRNEDSQFARTTNIDWAGLEINLRRQLQQSLTAVISVEETIVDVFSVSIPTDPVTGA
jgi:hypothetical protein